MSNIAGVAVGGEAANPNGGMALANGKHAPAESIEWDREASLSLRLLRAQNDVSVLALDANVTGETAKGGKFSYQGITAAQIVARAKAALFRQGVLYIPVMDKNSVKIDGNKTSLWVDASFISVDKEGEQLNIGSWGSGTDNAANGIAKAFTNANKQILAKTLCMTTVEDDQEKETPHEPDSAAQIRKEAKQDKNKTLQAWAASYKTALSRATTLEEIIKLQRENREQLMAEETPDVTRDFFIDLFEQRKKLLGGDNAQ